MPLVTDDYPPITKLQGNPCCLATDLNLAKHLAELLHCPAYHGAHGRESRQHVLARQRCCCRFDIDALRWRLTLPMRSLTLPASSPRLAFVFQTFTRHCLSRDTANTEAIRFRSREVLFLLTAWYRIDATRSMHPSAHGQYGSTTVQSTTTAPSQNTETRKYLPL